MPGPASRASDYFAGHMHSTSGAPTGPAETPHAVLAKGLGLVPEREAPVERRARQNAAPPGPTQDDKDQEEAIARLNAFLGSRASMEKVETMFRSRGHISGRSTRVSSADVPSEPSDPLPNDADAAASTAAAVEAAVAMAAAAAAVNTEPEARFQADAGPRVFGPSPGSGPGLDHRSGAVSGASPGAVFRDGPVRDGFPESGGSSAAAAAAMQRLRICVPRSEGEAKVEDSPAGQEGLRYLDIPEAGMETFKAFAKGIASKISLECSEMNPYIRALKDHRKSILEGSVDLMEEEVDSLEVRLGTQRDDALARLDVSALIAAENQRRAAAAAAAASSAGGGSAPGLLLQQCTGTECDTRVVSGDQDSFLLTPGRTCSSDWTTIDSPAAIPSFPFGRALTGANAAKAAAGGAGDANAVAGTAARANAIGRQQKVWT